MNLIAYSLIYLMYAIISIWITTRIMIENKKVFSFMPFLIVGVSFCFYSVLMYYEVYAHMIWFFVELSFGLSLLWIFITIRRGKYGFNK
ncbi:MAG: hypothetical protein GY861_27655 [bacterium]|nr:hypothetical protein [bacterium]